MAVLMHKITVIFIQPTKNSLLEVISYIVPVPLRGRFDLNSPPRKGHLCNNENWQDRNHHYNYLQKNIMCC